MAATSAMSETVAPAKNTRSSPRAVTPLEVDVEVAGETRRVLLISRDIGAGGMFLRTTKPAKLWSKVQLSIRVPEGGELTVSGEVVRSISVEQARAKKHPPGMAVAFDEGSRARRKKLVELVLELCSAEDATAEQSTAERQPGAEPTAAAAPAAPLGEPDGDEAEASVRVRPAASERAPVVGSEQDPDEHFSSRTDDLLGELDSLLEADGDEKPQPAPAAKAAPVAADPIRKLRSFIDGYKQRLAGDTHYHVLGVGLDADAGQIKAAYAELLAALQPPGRPEELPDDLARELSAVLGKVRKAFAILGKPDRKRAYDFLIDNADD